MQAVITSQIDRLDPEHRAVVRMAAVLGHTFRVEELAALSDEPLPTHHDGFWKAFDSILTFTGAGVRCASATRWSATPRTRSCRSAAGGSCTRAPATPSPSQVDRPEAEAELLSLHFFHANRFDDAWRFARIAATRALDKYANVEAAELLDRAINSARRGADVTVAELAEVWEALGDVTERSGIYDRALHAVPHRPPASRARTRSRPPACC